MYTRITVSEVFRGLLNVGRCYSTQHVSRALLTCTQSPLRWIKDVIHRRLTCKTGKLRLDFVSGYLSYLLECVPLIRSYVPALKTGWYTFIVAMSNAATQIVKRKEEAASQVAQEETPAEGRHSQGLES